MTQEVPQPYSIYDDPGYKALRRELKYAGVRIAANATVIALDVIPGSLVSPGEHVSWAFDAFKYGKRLVWWTPLRKVIPNTTPDAGLISTVGTEVTIDPLSGGWIPSHAAETLVQVVHDLDRLKRYRSVRWQAFRGVDHEKIRDYLYEASKNDRIFKEMEAKKPIELSDLSAQEILDLVPKPLF
jgi:hypothetical protein